ncbi:MAG: (2Fe-2S)-binding protein [Planctomycetota bacterium]|jgi:aerobic-type carbon monoxide dehydrogenase small subunit (CoxS/CutS family)
MSRSPITLTVNGDPVEAHVDTRKFLLDFLRDDLGLTGTNRGCDQGDCGACTVWMNGEAVNACLVLAVEADGTEILTIEGLARDGKLHPVQEAFVEEGAIQCGYCTPGMVMQAAAFLKAHPEPSPAEARRSIEGNLCRCTGYERIVKAILTAASKLQG